MTLNKTISREEYLELLEDVALLKKRVTELEKNQKSIVRFLMARFSQKAAQIRKILKLPEDEKIESVTVLGQDLTNDMTDEQAIKRLFTARTIVGPDPVLAKVYIRGEKEEDKFSQLPAKLRR